MAAEASSSGLILWPRDDLRPIPGERRCHDTTRQAQPDEATCRSCSVDR
jgi:hypothetical protein